MSNEWNRKSAHYRQTLPRFGYTIFSHMCVNDWILFVRFASSLPRTPIRLLHCSHTGSVYFDTVHTHLTNLTCSSLARQISKWSETCTHTDTTLLLKHMFIIFVFVYIWLIEMFKNIHMHSHSYTAVYVGYGPTLIDVWVKSYDWYVRYVDDGDLNWNRSRFLSDKKPRSASCEMIVFSCAAALCCWRALCGVFSLIVRSRLFVRSLAFSTGSDWTAEFLYVIMHFDRLRV